MTNPLFKDYSMQTSILPANMTPYASCFPPLSLEAAVTVAEGK